jgi:hypothetical protein
MKLKELLEAIDLELEGAGCTRETRVSLAFVARRDRDGEVECDFVDASQVSKPREGEIHRLELCHGETNEERELDGASAVESVGFTPRKKTALPSKKRLAAGIFADCEDKDKDPPAIYRARAAAV